MVGRTDTQMRYDLYGLGSASTIFRDSKGEPSENIEGVILNSISIGSDVAYDNKWASLFSVNAKEGESVANAREFFVLIEGEKGNDGNLINIRLSSSKDTYEEIEGSKIYSFLPSVRVANYGRITQLGVDVPRDVSKLQIENFDSANGSVTFAGRFRSMSLAPSGQDEWRVGTVTLKEDEKGSLVAVNLSGGYEMPNDASIYAEDDKKRPVAISLPPKQFKINKRPKIELLQEPRTCKLVKFDASNSFDPDKSGSQGALSFRWYFHDGSQASGSVVEHNYSKPGSYPVRLEIFDDSGQIGNGTAQDFDVFVKAPPVAKIDAPNLVAQGEEFSFNAIWEKFESEQKKVGLESFDWQLRPSNDDTPVDKVSTKQGEQKYTFADNGRYVVSLTVTDDSDHPCNVTTVSKFIDVNGAPIADAGAGQIVALGSSVSLSAQNSTDPDGDALVYAWNFGDGKTANTKDAEYTFEKAGTYEVELKVDDQKGAKNSVSSASITVVVNVAPIAAMDIESNMLTSVAAKFDAVNSVDKDGEIVSYQWTLSDGTIVDRPSFEHAFFEEGSYEVKLTIKDDSGIENGVQTLTKTIVVKDQENITPIAKSNGDQDSFVGDIVKFSSQGSLDEDGTILAYDWDFGDGTFAKGLTAQHVYQAPDTYKAKLTVTDNSGKQNNQSVDEFIIVVAPKPNEAGIARAGGDRKAYVNEIVTFDAQGSRDTDGSLLAYIWDLGDGNKASGFNVRHSYKAPGTYKVTLLVRDDSGRSNQESETSFMIDVAHAPNSAPTLALPKSFNLVQGEQFVFDASSAKDIDGNIVGYEWHFGNGITSDKAIVAHAYDKVGAYSAKLVLTDNSGFESGISTIPFTVYVTQKPNIAPTANAGENITTKAGDVVEFDGSGSFDKDGNIIRYEWDFGNGSIGEGEKILFSYFERGEYNVKLKVTDGSKQANDNASDEIVVRVLDKDNESPVARVQPNRGAAIDEPVPFSGQSSGDEDGNIIKYSWDFGDGNAAIGRDVVHQYAKSGRYVARLTIQDDSGLESGSGTVTREIVVNEPPVANAGSDQHVTASVVYFDASNSVDADGDIIRYSWDFGDGKTGKGQKVQHTYREPGKYVVKLEIEDSSGTIRNLAQDELNLTVNALPIADAGFDVEVAPLEEVIFDGTRSEDSDGSIAQYLWDFKDGSNGVGETVSHAFEKPGTYFVELKVLDNTGHANAFDVSSVRVVVNEKPTAIAGPNIAVAPGEVFTLDGQDSFDVNGEISSWRWDFSSELETSEQAVFEGSFETPGIYTAILTVNDDSVAKNNTSQDSLQIFVNHAPIAEAGKDIFSEKLQIVLDAGASVDADNDGLSYRWKLGDGNVKYGSKVTHTYADGGVYPVILTVDDGRGLANSKSVDSMTLTINRSPIAVAGQNQDVCVGDTVVFDGSGSSDPDNDLIRFEWDFGNGESDTIINPTRVFNTPGVKHVKLKVEDESDLPNNTHNDALIIAVKDAPQANAGKDILACANTAVQFDGTKSTDIDGVVNRFNWEFGDNTSGGGDRPKHSYSVAGTYRARLTIVGDTDGQCSPTSTDEVSVKIVNAPRAVIKANSSAALGEWVEFDASLSYADGAELKTYAWDMGDGNGLMGAKIRHKFDKPGTYRVKLNVVAPDLADQCETNESVHVIKVNEAPEAVISTNNEVVAGRALKLNAGVSFDKDGGIVSYDWDFGDGNTAKGIEVSHIWREAGKYEVKMSVKDDSGVSNDTSETVFNLNVLPALVPQIEAQQAACVGAAHSFKLLNVDQDVDLSSLKWNFGDGASAAGAANGAATQHSYARSGTYTVSVSGSVEMAGEMVPLLASKEVIVNAPPVPRLARFVASCPALSVEFDGGRSFDKDGEIINFDWNFGDGNKANGSKVSHKFEKPGKYQVELEVKDDSASMCATSTRRMEVFINAPPKANAGADINAKAGGARDRINFDASGSSDGDGDGLYYYWSLSNGDEFEGERPSYVFSKPGTYTAELTASDPHGLSCSIASDTVDITVESHVNE
ncbi:MAG: PKD domain-containing protein [Nitratireductor sp.]